MHEFIQKQPQLFFKIKIIIVHDFLPTICKLPGFGRQYHSFGFESKNVTFSKADPTRGQVSQIEFEIKISRDSLSNADFKNISHPWSAELGYRHKNSQTFYS